MKRKEPVDGLIQATVEKAAGYVTSVHCAPSFTLFKQIYLSGGGGGGTVFTRSRYHGAWGRYRY